MKTTDSLIILHVAYITSDFSSGVSTVVPQYLNEQSKIKGINVGLLNLANYRPRDAEYPVFTELCIERLPDPFCNPSVVVFHEIYRPDHIKLSHRLKTRAIPYIITPHGSLTHVAQNQKHFAKQALNLFFYNAFIRNAECVHFLSEKEALNSTGFKLKKASIIPNGVSIPKVKATCDKTPTAIFIGRLDIKVKGLDLLINCLPPIAEELRGLGAKINIYGPDEDGSMARLEQLITNNQVTDIVSLCGPVNGQSKKDAFLHSQFYVQLSRTEGFPTSVLEALAYGLPIVVTEGTTWKEIANNEGIGIGVKSDLTDISNAILTLFKEDKLRSKFSIAARNYAIENFQWRAIAKRQIDLYRDTACGFSNQSSCFTGAERD